MNPVSSRMGLGAWHSICSFEGLCSMSRTISHRGLVVLVAVGKKTKQAAGFVESLIKKTREWFQIQLVLCGLANEK